MISEKRKVNLVSLVSSTKLEKIVFLSAFIVLLVQLYADMRSDVVQDASHYFTIAHGIKNGLKPYVDLFDVKSVGIYLILLLPIFLAKGLYLSSYLIPSRKLIIICMALYGSWATFGSYQPEAFGFLFAFLYVINRKMWLGGLLLLACVGMKEPFILSLLGAHILLKRPLKEFAFHLLTAVIIGLTALLVWGIFNGYLEYLDVVFHHRIHAKDPLLFRGLYVYAVGKELGVLGIIFAAVWIHRYPKIILSGLALHFTLIFLNMLPLAYKMPLFWLGVIPYVGLLYCLRFVDWRHTVALYLGILATSVAGSAAAHHFIMGFPVIFALLMTDPNTKEVRIRNMILTVVFLLTFQVSPVYKVDYKNYEPRLDKVMDECHFNRYLMVPHNEYFYNKHSPVGPIFSALVARMIGPNHELMLQTVENAADVPIVVVKGTNWFYQDISNWLSEHYINEKPPCASYWEEIWYVRKGVFSGGGTYILEEGL